MRLLLRLLFLLSLSVSATAAPVFRLHLSSEPQSLNPHAQRTSNSNYLLGNLFRNIYILNSSNELIPDLGSCKKKDDKTLVCTLKKGLHWSDGSPLTAQDFLDSYLRILNPENRSPRADILFPIKNAQQIYQAKAKDSTLGVQVLSPEKFKIEFTTSIGEFEYDLAHFLTAPTKKDLNVFSGPFKMKEWQRGQKITLENNKLFHVKKNRPQVEFLFIEEDAVALQLYEKNQLQFLRRLPSLFIPQFKLRADFHWVPVIRFDYFGFGPELKNQEALRKSLTSSLNYIELQKIFSSPGRPGCLGLPDSWFPEKAPCYTYNPQSPKVSAELSKKSYVLMFSSLGGEDHRRATEWIQEQWKKNIGFQIQPELKENKIFLQTLKNTPPALFRKGAAPDHPTCLSALQTFSKESLENYIGLQSEDYQKILNDLAKSKKSAVKKKLCLDGARYLLDRFLLIPTGPIHFSILAKPDWQGWKINQLNQLDLSDLHLRP